MERECVDVTGEVRRKTAGLLGLLVILGLSILGWWTWASAPFSTANTPGVFSIASGATTSNIASELVSRHLIRSAKAFIILARYYHVDAKLMPGDYNLNAAMTPQEIIQQLLKGPNTDIVHVTIPEGFNTEQIIALLVQKGLGTQDEITKAVTSDNFPYSFLKGQPSGIHRLEGFLFPDTYFFKKGTSPHIIIDTMLQQFQKELTPANLSRLQAMKLSIHNWVTLASIVEKEAKKPQDRPLIASVFFNRLKINMPLQSCATIQFALGTPKPKLYDKDLQIKSPYNTYLHKGLPPGPIANPGDASLQAVLHPAHTDYYYFLAKSDGSSVFAKTYAEHLQNQKKYLQ